MIGCSRLNGYVDWLGKLVGKTSPKEMESEYNALYLADYNAPSPAVGTGGAVGIAFTKRLSSLYREPRLLLLSPPLPVPLTHTASLGYIG